MRKSANKIKTFLFFLLISSAAVHAMNSECLFLQLSIASHFSADSLPPDPLGGTPVSSTRAVRALGFTGSINTGFQHPQYPLHLRMTEVQSEYQRFYDTQIQGAFTFIQRTSGQTRILHPEWIRTRDVEQILRNMDLILEHDLLPVIQLNWTLSENGIRQFVEHETVHYLDSLLPEGRRRIAINLARANIDPRYVAEAMAFDVFTELRAYAFNHHPGIRGAVEQLDAMARQNSPSNRLIVIANAPNLIMAFWDAVKVHYLNHDPNFQLTELQRVQTGNLLAELILRYPLLDRLPNYSNL